MAGARPCTDEQEADTKSANASVALLFLVQDKIPTEPVWAAFIAAAAELQRRLPVPPTNPAPATLLPKISGHQSELNSKCWRHRGPMTYFSLGNPPRKPFNGPVPPQIDNVTAWLQGSCHNSLTGRQLYAMQDLYTIYVHRSPQAPVAPEDSIFASRDISNRVKATFAQSSLVRAHRRLLTVALQDHRNTMFLLISETCIPLYHPALMWAQLMAESHISRVADSVYNSRRWSPMMTTNYISAQKFQKSDQWVSLTRMHAELVANDEHVWTMFQLYCKTQVACHQRNPQYGHTCVADEHFVATLLASYDMSESRDGIGELTYVDWSSEDGPWHPRTFYPGNASAAIRAMRSRSAEARCQAVPEAALASLKSVFSIKKVCFDDVLTPDNRSVPGDSASVVIDAAELVFAQRRLAGLEHGGAATAHAEEDRSTSASQGLLRRPVRRPPQWQPGITETAVLEMSPEREELHVERANELHSHMTANLRATGWLGDFEPMHMNCPLLGRRVSAQAVSDFAAQVWRCEGLGFDSQCLNAAQQ